MLARFFSTPRSVLAATLLTAALLPGTTLADDSAVPADLAERLVINGRAMAVEAVESTPLPGIFRIQLESGQSFYSDRNGEYLLVGELYRNGDDGMVNLTEQRQQRQRSELLAQLPDDDTVIFRPAGEVRAVLNVFTDTTCPYCRQFHGEVPALLERGIEVRYLAFPRSGLNGEGARELSSVWCSDNRSEAMTAAMEGREVESDGACSDVVSEQFALGRRMAIQGTPAIVLPDGRMVPGYVPVERLVGMLGLDQ